MVHVSGGDVVAPNRLWSEDSMDQRRGKLGNGTCFVITSLNSANFLWPRCEPTPFARIVNDDEICCGGTRDA
jgi:hypothetical protein